MPDDTENAPEDRLWRSAETFQGFLDYVDEFRRSPHGQQLQADQQAAEADLLEQHSIPVGLDAWGPTPVSVGEITGLLHESS